MYCSHFCAIAICKYVYLSIFAIEDVLHKSQITQRIRTAREKFIQEFVICILGNVQ